MESLSVGHGDERCKTKVSECTWQGTSISMSKIHWKVNVEKENKIVAEI